MLKEGVFIWESEVRNYELDFQGVVGNARYLEYLSHARVKYLEALGLDFYGLANNDCDFVLAHVDIAYRAPLLGGDHFSVESRFSLSGKIRILCHQTVFKLPSRERVTEAVTTLVCISRKTRKPIFPEVLQKLF